MRRGLADSERDSWGLWRRLLGEAELCLVWDAGAGGGARSSELGEERRGEERHNMDVRRERGWSSASRNDLPRGWTGDASEGEGSTAVSGSKLGATGGERAGLQAKERGNRGRGDGDRRRQSVRARSIPVRTGLAYVSDPRPEPTGDSDDACSRGGAHWKVG